MKNLRTTSQYLLSYTIRCTQSRQSNCTLQVPVSRNQQKTKKSRGKISCLTFFCSHKFKKIVPVCYFIFEKVPTWANWQKILSIFNPKIPRYGKKHRFPDPGFGSATLPVPYTNFECQHINLTRQQIPVTSIDQSTPPPKKKLTTKEDHALFAVVRTGSLSMPLTR